MAKVLLIEDEANVRTLTEMQLKHLGYEVLLADNGWKGLELYRRRHPDVIVLDLTLPGMNGVGILKQIRSVDQRQLVIVVTGGRYPEDRAGGPCTGVSEFISSL